MELHQRKILSLKQWKDLATTGEPPKDCLVIVSADIEETKQIDEDGNVFRFIISTENPDRDKDVIHVDGWRFENYNKNPVVLFGHNYRSLPVAAGSPPTVDGVKVLSNADFGATRVDAFADTVRQYVKAKVLRASSVGFDPMKWMFNEERRGYDFVEQELLEWSIVPVPANADALQLAKSLGLDLHPIRDWAIRTLDEWSEEKGVYVPRSLLEKAAKLGDTDRVFVIFAKGDIDGILDGTVKGEKEETPTPAVPADENLVPMLTEINAQLKHLVENSFVHHTEKPAPAAEPVVDNKQTGTEAEDVAVEIVDDDAEVLLEVDPEELRESIRLALGPLIMERTGRVI